MPSGFGDGRGSQPNASAAALTTAIERARLKPLSSVVLAVSSFRRNSTGSAFAAAASSSMNDSEANVDCGPFGSRRLPVRSGVSQTSGRLTTCVGHAPVRDRVHVRRRRRAAGRRRGAPRAHQLRDQHGVGLVVAEVVVVGGARVVVERDEIALRVETAAHLERRTPGPSCPTPFLRCRIHCTRTGRPISFARNAASKPASSAAVRP